MIGNADGTWFTKWKFHFHFQSLDAAIVFFGEGSYLNVFRKTGFQILKKPGSWRIMDAAEQKNRAVSYQVIEVIVRALFRV